MTTGPYVLPQATLVIILGASTFPRCRLESSPAFGASAEGIRDYFVSDDGFHLPPINLLDLFDSPKGPSEIMDDIADFLIARQDALKTAPGPRAGDLLVYYAGHGGFTLGGDYFLALRNTRENYEGGTSLRMSDLATTIKESARPLRRFLILDCCFSAASFAEFQSAPLSAARRQTMTALPQEGTTLLCSSNARSVSIAPSGARYTMFSGALIEVLCQGVPHFGPWISMEQVGAAVRDLIREKYPDDAVRPEVLSPDQAIEDIARVPLFPNKAPADAEIIHQRSITPQHQPHVSQFLRGHWPSSILGFISLAARRFIASVVGAPLRSVALVVATIAAYITFPATAPPSTTSPIQRDTFIAVALGPHRSWFGSNSTDQSPFGEEIKKILGAAIMQSTANLTAGDLGRSLRESVFVNSNGAARVYLASSVNATDEVIPPSGKVITSVISFNDDKAAYQFYKMLPVSATRLSFYSDGVGAPIREQLRDVAIKIGHVIDPEDTIIIYIAGHGYTTNSALELSPYNVKFGSFRWNSIDLNEMGTFLDQLRFRRVFWLVDPGD